MSVAIGVQVLQYSRKELEKNITKMFYSNQISYIYNSQA